MIELRLHAAVYSGASIEEAARVYGSYATVECDPPPASGGHRLVRVTAANPARERRVARELANYALGLSIAAYRK